MHSADQNTSAQTPFKAGAKRIVIIDDEQMIADTLTDILNTHGFHASAAYSAKEALALVANEHPDILITDVLMPGMNGVDMAIQVREHSPSTRVLLFSGQAGTMDLLYAASQQGHEFELLPKPIHPRELLKRLLD